jgi:cell division protein ftsA
MMNTVLGLLAKGNLNCAGSEISDDLFGNINHSTSVARPSESLQKPSETPINRQPEKPTPAESDVQTKDTDIVDEEDTKREPGALSKFGKSLKDFISKMASEEE